VCATALAGGYLAAVPVAALVDDWAAAKAVDDAARAAESVQRLQVAEAAGVVERAVKSVQHLQAVEAVGVVVPVAAYGQRLEAATVVEGRIEVLVVSWQGEEIGMVVESKREPVAEPVQY
jgi:hypothetical protein